MTSWRDDPPVRRPFKAARARRRQLEIAVTGAAQFAPARRRKPLPPWVRALTILTVSVVLWLPIVLGVLHLVRR
jgi:hypothetical protein